MQSTISDQYVNYLAIIFFFFIINLIYLFLFFRIENIELNQLIKTENEFLKILEQNSKAYLTKINLNDAKLLNFNNSLEKIFNFHQNIMYPAIKPFENDTSNLFQILTDQFDEKVLEKFIKYSMLAGLAIDKLQKNHVSKVYIFFNLFYKSNFINEKKKFKLN